MVRRLLAGIGVGCLAVWAARAENPGAETLAGVTNVVILVEPVKAELAQKGLTAAQITKDVESQFRLAGVPTAADTVGGTPFLHVQVSATSVDGSKQPLYAYHVAVSFLQFVFLRRTEHLAVAATWRDGATGSVRAEDVLSIRDAIRTLVTRFLRDLKAASRPAPAPDPAGAAEAPSRPAP